MVILFYILLMCFYIITYCMMFVLQRGAICVLVSGCALRFYVVVVGWWWLLVVYWLCVGFLRGVLMIILLAWLSGWFMIRSLSVVRIRGLF